MYGVHRKNITEAEELKKKNLIRRSTGTNEKLNGIRCTNRTTYIEGGKPRLIRLKFKDLILAPIR